MPSSSSRSIVTLSLHDALPILRGRASAGRTLSSHQVLLRRARRVRHRRAELVVEVEARQLGDRGVLRQADHVGDRDRLLGGTEGRSEEHTSELQSPIDLVCLRPRLVRSSRFPYTTLFRSCVAVLPPGGLCRATRSFCAGHAGFATGAPNWWLRWRPVSSATAESFGRQITSGTETGFLAGPREDRKSTRLNSSHRSTSYAFVLVSFDRHAFPTRRSSDLAWPCFRRADSVEPPGPSAQGTPGSPPARRTGG